MKQYGNILTSALFSLMLMTTAISTHAATFSKPPLAGTWRIEGFIPALPAGVPPEELNNAALAPQTIVKLEYLGARGSEWPRDLEYRLTILDPVPPVLCRLRGWEDACHAMIHYPPATLTTRGYVEMYPADENGFKTGHFRELKTVGLKPGMPIFLFCASDSSVVYELFFTDANTAYNTVYFDLKEGGKSVPVPHDVLQVWRRIQP